ncbi:PAS domain-containing protein [Rubrobacter tropicus]|uniref:PAS domain-containing protein n=1 Tax=Rubrobacter tropicus TaxID=2653851 RepID=A0A6G8QBW0_9ACTN|nr:PAS domain-containing protein [Rubrobacter tropicus]QIN83928.1 PAS domain-containing protein [Rubrobacter tropicus]
MEGTAGGLLESSSGGTLAASGHVFVFAARGLRRLDGRGDEFLGYSAEEMFWKDVLGLVHEDDLPRVRALISDVMDDPGASFATHPRLRERSGEWRTVELTVRNVLEAPDDTGLVVANARAAQTPRPGGQS